jgi:hypothetical protein
MLVGTIARRSSAAGAAPCATLAMAPAKQRTRLLISTRP